MPHFFSSYSCTLFSYLLLKCLLFELVHMFPLRLTSHLFKKKNFFLLQGLRKSSDCGRTKTNIMPRSVPHMVQLRKFVVSEDTVFLLLQYAEGKGHISVSSVSSSLICLLYLHLSFPLLLLTLRSPAPLCALVPDRCLIEMGVCHRSLF